MKRWLAAFAFLALASCARPAPPPAPVALDCARGFDELATRIAADPAVKLAPSPGEPYRYYNSADGKLSYVVTETAAPAHPAIVRQVAGADRLVTDGCGFGDRPSYDKLLAYLRDLARGR